MSESIETRAHLLLATAAFEDGKIILRLEDKDRTVAEFELDPIGAAMLSLTLHPAMKLALEEQKRLHPEKFERGGFPDSPEGL